MSFDRSGLVESLLVKRSGRNEKKLLELVVSIGAGSAWLFEIVSVDSVDSYCVFFLLCLGVLHDIWSEEGILALSMAGSLLSDVGKILKVNGVFSEVEGV